jgi:hypothetical protein
MNHRIFAVLFLSLLVAAVAVLPAPGFAADQQEEFQRILNLDMNELTAEARAVLEARYPDADWGQYEFPSYAYSSEAVETGYRIAVKEPGLLAEFKCYCFCDAMGHADLRWCFLKGGELDRGFDEHAVGCNICYGQAMRALLWQEAGVPPAKMTAGFEKKYEKLIERFGD